ncbi:helix-turn-helix domain-containing protein [Metabacillus dongyingensis]|uniref:ArsR/SmtB family transcription factor n=1 Tax=Metabacillus dongyingensis TaxID=2874282 RepID=UPI003B8E8948
MLNKSFKVESLEQLKALSDPMRIKILWKMVEKAKTGKMIADELQIAAPKIHYHLKELEKIGLVIIERTEEKNGIVQKFYRPIAKEIHVSKTFISSSEMDDSIMESFKTPLEESINLLNQLDTQQLMQKRFDEQLISNFAHSAFLSVAQALEVQNKFSELAEMIERYSEANIEDPTCIKHHVQFMAFPVFLKKKEEDNDGIIN